MRTQRYGSTVFCNQRLLAQNSWRAVTLTGANRLERQSLAAAEPQLTWQAARPFSSTSPSASMWPSFFRIDILQ